MKGFHEARALIRARLDEEIGTIRREAPRRVALVYPSPYHVGDVVARLSGDLRHAATASTAGPPSAPFCPTTSRRGGARGCRSSPTRARRRSAATDVIAFSVAYELELAGLFDCLDAAPGSRCSPPSATAAHPLVVAGGPLTFSNPLPLGAVRRRDRRGRGRGARRSSCCAAVDAEPDRAALLERAGAHADGFWVPSLHGERLPPVAQADDALLPARSAMLTPHTELRSMFLIEAERGCSRGCTYCVMRRSTNGGMRMVAPDVRARRHPRGRAPRRPGRRGGHRPSARSPRSCAARRRRPRGRHLVAARRSARPTSSSACSRAAAIAR